MKARLLSLIALFALCMSVFAEDVDVTSKVSTSWPGAGLCATQYAPAVTTADGRTAQMNENYQANVNATGVLLSQTVSGLENGDYTVVLYANAFYTDGRGFDSEVTDGDMDVAYVFANAEQVPVKAQIATSTPANGEYSIDVTVNDGTLKLGLGKSKAGTNWHTIQIKSLTMHVSGVSEAMIQDAMNRLNTVPVSVDLTAINAAKAAIDADPTFANLDALNAAIDAAIAEVNVTTYITNPTINGSDGWVTEKPNGGNGPLLGGTSFEYWNASSANGAFDYYQTINDLPAGKYVLSAEMYNSSNGEGGADGPKGNAGLYAVSGENNVFTGVTEDGTTLKVYATEEIEVTDGTLRIGVKNNGSMFGARWFVADNFQLWYAGPVEEELVMEVETALVLGEEEVTINDHSEVSVDAADAIKVNVMNAPTAVGFSYNINVMKEVADEEGTTWVADESADLAVGEGSLNTIGFAQFDDVVYFEQGSKYQVKVTVYGGNPAEPTEVGFYTYVINGSHAIEPEIAASLIAGEEEIALNSHSAVSVETADAVSVAFDGVIPTSASYKINSLIEVLGEESSTWEVNETIAEGELSLSGKGYAEFEEQVTFEQGTKYQVEISYVEAPESDPVVVTYNVDGAYVAPVIAGVSLSYNKVESDLNSHSEVSIETADELIVRFGKPVDVIGAMYVINEMVMGSDDEGTFWNPGAEIAVGEMSINTIGAVQFETPINFVQGKKYQVSVTAFGGTMDDPTELGTETYVFNGAYTEEEPEPVIAGANLDFEDNSADYVTVSALQGYQRNVKDDQLAGMQPLTSWEGITAEGQVVSDPGWCGGVFAYGSSTLLNNKYAVPAAGPEGETDGAAVGLTSVWGGIAQYTQAVTLPAGNYTVTFKVYNQGGTVAVTDNIFGFIANDGTKYLSDVKTWAVGKWSDMTVNFTLEEETEGKLSMGYQGNGGSGNVPHLFVDNIKIESVSELDLAKADAFAKVPAAGEGIFAYDEETVTGWTLAISNAKSVEEVEAVVASIESTPVQAELNTYTIYNVTAENYLGTATNDKEELIPALSAEPVEVTFEKANGGYYIKMGDNYVNMKGTDNWSMSVGAEPTTAWNFNLADGVYTISGPKGMIGTDNTAAGSATYGDKNAAKNGTWVIEAVPSTEIAVYPALVVGEEEIALNEHSAVSAETVDAISVAFENVVPATASYKLSSMVLVAGEESSSWELNETIAEGELSINGKAYVEFEEPVLFEQGTKYQLDITYAPMEGEATTVSYLIDGAYAAPLIAAVDFINGEEVYTINSHSTVSIPASESIKVTFGNAVDVASATYAIMPMYPVETEEGTTWVPSMPNAEFGELSINTYGYAELAKTYEQGTKYQLDINVTYLDGTDYSESFQFDGATAGDEPTEPEIAVTYYKQGPVLDVVFTNQKDVAASFNVDILLDGVKADVELGQYLNELYVRLSEELAAGEHKLVFPVGSLIFDNANDNTEEYTVTFTVEGPQESILGEPEIAIADDVLTITFDAPEGVEGASLASAGVVITKGETQYYGNAEEAYAENGKIVVTVPLASTMDMNTFSPYEPTEGDELTIAIKDPEVCANHADGTWEKVWEGDDIVASYTVAAEPINYKDLVNGDFSDGKNGWTTTTAGGAWSDATGTTPKVVEAYAGWGSLEMTDFSINQKVVLPAGTYKLSAYAFYRYGLTYDVDPSKSCAKLYAGENSVDVVTLGSIEASPYANDVNAASAAFAAGNYLNEVIFTVEEDGTEIEVGIAGKHELKQSWFICGPFSIEKYDPSTGIENIEIATKSNGKYIENGKVVIVRNGVKYNMNGVMIK